MTVNDEKKKIRKQMLLSRAKLPTLSKAKYDQRICKTLLEKIEEHHFRIIHCYLPMGTEIDIFPLIESLLEKKKTVVVPRTLPNRNFKNLILTSLDKLEKGVFGTMHPAGDKEFVGDYDLIIVPGLSFDSNNYRLGYGGGYYDNFMTSQPSAKKIGIFYPFQEVEKIPLESHDVKLDEIVVGKDLNGL